ncbi:MAG: M20/M25/M40 family metallo-hydrolase, partial [Planctomycetales bacterium]|nr:M20/M25/M40 family metallo-hydrolase [Planctomycetales bacterium]
SYQIDQQWRPAFFSKEGLEAAKGVVFAGYGIVAPADGDQSEYDSYVHLDVKDKWVLVFRQMPQDIPAERRQHLARYSGERYKAMVARDRGAAGLIFVSGPTSPLRQRLLPLRMDGSLGASSLTVISVQDEVASAWFNAAGKELLQVQQALDGGEPQMGFPLDSVALEASIDIEPITSHGRNVLAMLPAGGEPREEMIVIGAHIDHLGTGKSAGSLAKEEEQGGVHRGADDNASGVASMLEIAQYLASQVRSSKLQMQRDVLFAAWSGEELGLRGSQAFVEDFAAMHFAPSHPVANPHEIPAAGPAGHAASTPLAHPHASNDTASSEASPDRSATSGGNKHTQSIYPRIAACINLDMVGRLREQLVLQGIGSSDYWSLAIEQRNAVVGLPVTLQDDCNLPTDASSFFLRGVPILSAFTGSHAEYHTPRDVPELLNYEGAAKIANLMALIARGLTTADAAPNYKEQTVQPEMRANLVAYLGTIPDYAQDGIQGVKLSGATKGAPAAQAGLRAGDIIVELAGRKIENIYDYTYAIEALKVGQPTKVKIQRGDETLLLDITPASRQ